MGGLVRCVLRLRLSLRPFRLGFGFGPAHKLTDTRFESALSCNALFSGSFVLVEAHRALGGMRVAVFHAAPFAKAGARKP